MGRCLCEPSGSNNGSVVLRAARTSAGVWCVVMLLVGVLGCPPPRPPVPVPPPITLREAIDRYNRNVATIGAFAAQVTKWKIEFRNAETGEMFDHSDMGGRVFYRRHREGATGRVFISTPTRRCSPGRW